MLLRKDDAWLEKLPIPDIRNWRVLDQNGDEVGFVETLVVDRQNNAFEALLVGANDRFSADEVDVEAGVVRITRPLHRTSEGVGDPNGYHPDFETSYRRHFERTYDGDRWAFEDLLPAYRFGREIASDADFAGRPFQSAEDDLKAYYLIERRRPAYKIARDAIRCAYTLVQRIRPFEPGGLDREEMQILDRSVKAAQDSRTAGAAMSTRHREDDQEGAGPNENADV